MAEMKTITLNGKRYEIPEGTTFDPTNLANLHVWRRTVVQGSGGYAPSCELETAYTWIHDSSSVSPVTRFQGQYADAVAVTDGVLGLVDPVSIPTVYADRDSVIPGKYITARCKDDNTTYIYLVPTGDAYSSLSGTTTYATGQVGSWVRAYRMVETGDAVYVCSENADAYSGTGYEYLGRLGDAFESGGIGEIPENVVTCDLEGATEDESAVPVNADTLDGHSPAYYRQIDAVTAYVREELLGMTATNKIPVTISAQSGSAFLQGDGTIICTKAGYVLVQGFVETWYFTTNNVYHGFFVTVNDSVIAEKYTSSAITNGLVIPAVVVPVSAGDEIALNIELYETTGSVMKRIRTGMTVIYVG